MNTKSSMVHFVVTFAFPNIFGLLQVTIQIEQSDTVEPKIKEDDNISTDLDEEEHI